MQSAKLKLASKIRADKKTKVATYVKENHSLPLILPDFEVNSCLARATAL